MELVSFNYNHEPIRTASVDGEPVFIAADICRVLDIGNVSQTLSYLDDDERGVISSDTPSGPQAMSYVTESGLYSMILRSRKPQAKPFKRWVTHEVLPSIRKTGGYGTAAPREVSRLELIDMAREAELGRLAEVERADAAEARVLEITPAADAWRQFLASTGDVSINEAAKALSRNSLHVMGERRLRSLLEDRGWIYRDSKRKPRAYQRQMDLGRLTERARSYRDQVTGEDHLAAPQVRVTARGLDAIRDMLSAMDK